MKLVNVADFGIKGINYYWERRDNFNLSKAELATVGVKGNDAMVDSKMIPKLLEANEKFKDMGYEIIVKDAYRSTALYDLVRKKRYENDGKSTTDKTFSTGSNPHSTGLTVDINLVSLETGQEVEMWDKADWPEGIFVDYYRNMTDDKSKRFQTLQDLLISTMESIGLKLGSRKEIHHFEYVQED